MKDYIDKNGLKTIGEYINEQDELLSQQIAAKQDQLVSGTNIKTINGQSILGEGDLEIQAGMDEQAVTELVENIALNGSVDTPSNNQRIIKSWGSPEDNFRALDAELIDKYIGESQEDPRYIVIDTDGRHYWIEATSENSANVIVLSPELENCEIYPEYQFSIAIETDTGDPQVVIGEPQVNPEAFDALEDFDFLKTRNILAGWEPEDRWDDSLSTLLQQQDPKFVESIINAGIRHDPETGDTFYHPIHFVDKLGNKYVVEPTDVASADFYVEWNYEHGIGGDDIYDAGVAPVQKWRCVLEPGLEAPQAVWTKVNDTRYATIDEVSGGDSAFVDEVITPALMSQGLVQEPIFEYEGHPFCYGRDDYNLDFLPEGYVVDLLTGTRYYYNRKEKSALDSPLFISYSDGNYYINYAGESYTLPQPGEGMDSIYDLTFYYGWRTGKGGNWIFSLYYNLPTQLFAHLSLNYNQQPPEDYSQLMWWSQAMGTPFALDIMTEDGGGCIDRGIISCRLNLPDDFICYLVGSNGVIELHYWINVGTGEIATYDFLSTADWSKYHLPGSTGDDPVDYDYRIESPLNFKSETLSENLYRQLSDAYDACGDGCIVAGSDGLCAKLVMEPGVEIINFRLVGLTLPGDKYEWTILASSYNSPQVATIIDGIDYKYAPEMTLYQLGQNSYTEVYPTLETNYRPKLYHNYSHGMRSLYYDYFVDSENYTYCVGAYYEGEMDIDMHYIYLVWPINPAPFAFAAEARAVYQSSADTNFDIHATSLHYSPLVELPAHTEGTLGYNNCLGKLMLTVLYAKRNESHRADIRLVDYDRVTYRLMPLQDDMTIAVLFNEVTGINYYIEEVENPK